MNDKISEEKRNYYQSVFQENEKKLAQTREIKEQKIKEKQRQEFIKREDKKENVERIMKIKEFEKDQIMQKIMNDNEKAQKLQFYFLF